MSSVNDSSDYHGGGDPIHDSAVPLDGNIIADILSKFLQWDPIANVVVLPEFRLWQLLECATGCGRGTQTVTADMLEGIGSVYALCLYYSMHPSASELSRRVVSLLQVIMCESLIIIQHSSPLSIGHPGSQLRFLRTLISGKYYMFDVFSDCIVFFKEIIRDLLKQVRTARDRPGIEKKKKHYLTDCMKAHCAYMACVLGLTHITIVCTAFNQLDRFPGLLESAMVALVTLPSASASQVSNDNDLKTIEESIANHMQTKAKEPSRFKKCFELCNRLAFCVVKGVDLSVLRQFVAVKGRLTRTLIEPKSAFAKTKSIEYRKLIKSIAIANSSETKNISSRNSERCAIPSTPAVHVFEAGKPVDKQFLMGLEFAEPPSNTSLSGIAQQAMSGNHSVVISSVDSHAIDRQNNQPQMNKAVNSQFPTQLNETLSGKLPLLHSVSPLKSIVKHSSEKADRELSDFWGLHERVRGVYLITRPLRLPLHQTSVVGDYIFRSINISPKKGLQSSENAPLSTKKDDLDKIEANYRSLVDDHQSIGNQSSSSPTLVEGNSVYLPRLLDPSEGIYWLAYIALESVEQEITSGNVFRPDDGAAIDPEYLVELMKKELDEMRTERLKPNLQDQVPYTTGTLNNDVNIAGTSTSDIRNSKKRATLLETRLHLAKQEASLEIRMTQANSMTRSNSAKTYNSPSKNYAKEISTVKSINANPKRLNSPVLKESLDDVLECSPSKSPTLKGSVDFARLLYFGDTVELSVVWRQKKLKDKEDAAVAAAIAAKNAKYASAKKIDPAGYVRDIREFRLKQKKEQETAIKKLEDTTESILGMLRTHKSVQIKQMKELQKRDVDDSLQLKEKMSKLAKEQRLAEKLQKQKEEEERFNEDEKEIFRIRAIKNKKRQEDDREEAANKKRQTKEKARLKEMSDKAEHSEILQRRMEEARMKYLEDIQRDKEKKATQKILKLKEDQFKLQLAAKREREKATNVVRNGNFIWHNGVLGFYKDARQTELPYIQYEDQYGTPYYFDPVLNKSTYEMPTTATIVHHTVKEREEYDSINGEGSYDQMMEDRKFKDQCNRDGGYFNARGVWLPLNGYYDPNNNYEFVPTL